MLAALHIMPAGVLCLVGWYHAALLVQCCDRQRVLLTASCMFPAGVLWLVGGCYAALLVQCYDYEVCG